MIRPFFDIRASWDKPDHDKAIASFYDWHEKTCPLSFRHSDRSRLSPRMLEACDSWQVGTMGLGLFGSTGTTKTRCMWELIRRVSQPQPTLLRTRSGVAGYDFTVTYSRIRVCIVRDVEFARECADQFKDGHDNRKLKLWHTCDVLFIDDLGKSRITERVQTELFDLVDSRTSNGLPILFTSNYSARDLKRRFSSPADADPVLRRLIENCMFIKA